MNREDIKALYLILFVLDVSLLSILFFQSSELSSYDSIYITCILCSHFLFFLSLWNKWYQMIDVLHYVLFLSIVISIFIQNIFLQSLVLFLLFIIQLLWVYKQRCIMNTCKSKHFWGYSSHITSFTIFYTILLSIKFGKDLY